MAFEFPYKACFPVVEGFNSYPLEGTYCLRCEAEHEQEIHLIIIIFHLREISPEIGNEIID